MAVFSGLLYGLLALFLLYLLLLRCKRRLRRWPLLTQYRYAHRGLHDEAAGIPENSLTAFRRAAEMGYGAELDVHLTRDGRLVVIHDSDLTRLCGVSRQVEEMTAAELSGLRLRGTEEPIPFLEQVLPLFVDRQPLVIEMKVARNSVQLVDALCAALEGYRGDYCVECFDPWALYVLRLRRPEEAVDLAALTPSAPIDADAVLARVWQLVESMEDDDYRAIATMMLQRREQDFRSIPAAKSVHHGFVGGLLMHTANMLEQADFLSRLYGSTINRSLLLAGTLLHDFGKMKEFSFSELGLVTEYSTEGQLLGHLVIGAEWVAAAARKLGIPEEKSLLLRHLILSHHGEPEFGAAVVPVCMESELLHLIDKIDSRVEIYRKAFEEVPVGAFSSRIFALEHRVYHHP